ncbi:MAG: HhoA/HhoB/HtrA family serine endopeptidase [Xenococcaceae cyanobacterium]
MNRPSFKSTENKPIRNDKRSRNLTKMAGYLGATFVGGAIALAGSNLVNTNQSIAQTSVAPNPTQQQASPQPVAAAITPPANFVTQVVKQVGPAVVRIDASRTVATQTPEILRDPFFRQFFGSQIPDLPEKQVQRGTGSGFIFDANGRIITNAHVVDGADKVRVTLKDGRSFEGKVLGADPLTDLAVIQINSKNLPALALGNSDSLEPGEWAIAIGNPLGLDNTVTTGIISGTGRSSAQIGVADRRVDFIQTDAAINPGNSGGPLLNDRGQVIGINTAIIQNAQGIGFAIPINTAQRIASQLIANGRVDHGYLGIQMAALTPDVQEKLKNSQEFNFSGTEKGVLIVGVMRNSPAAQIGLQSGDIIQSINGKTITEPNAVQQAVENAGVGANLPITVNRNGKTTNLNVRIASLPVQARAR